LNSTTTFSGEVVSATSCVSATFCGVGGLYHDSSGKQQAFVSVFNGTTWTDAEVAGVLNTGGLASVNSISCTSATSCVAGGRYEESNSNNQAFVSVFNGTNWTTLKVAGSLNQGGWSEVNSVSCTSANFCVAGGYYKDSNSKYQAFVSVFNGTNWTSSEVAGVLNATGTNARVSSVSCTSANFCVAGGYYSQTVGLYAFVSVFNGTTWTDTEVAGALNTVPFAYVSSVSCTSATSCVAGGTYRDSNTNQQAFVSVFNGTTWTDTEVAGALNTGGDARIKAMSCTSASFCVAGGSFEDSNKNYRAFVSVLKGTKWTDTEVAGALNVGGAGDILSVSCSSVFSCVAGGTYRESISKSQAFASVFNGTTWTDTEVAGDLNTGTYAYVNSVSCASATFCVAGGLSSASSFVVMSTYPEVTLPSSPEPPSGVGASAGNASAVVTWSAPSDDGGATITGYVVTASPGGATCTTTGALSCTVTGLANRTTYSFTVAAINIVGTGASSSPSSAVTPSAPVVVAPSVPGTPVLTDNHGSISLTWSAPTSSGGDTVTFKVEELTNHGSWSEVATGLTSPTYTYQGTTAKNTYCFAIIAVNSAGRSGWSSSAYLRAIAIKPSVPGTPVLTDNHGSISLAWSAPTNTGGDTVTYKVEELTNKGSWSQVATGLTSATYTFPGTTAKNTYSFAVIAVNSAGQSPWSGSSYLYATAAKPTAPGTPVLSDNHGSISLTWSAPTSSGGDTVTYKVEELTNQGSWSEVATGLTSPTYTYQGTTAKNTYCFAIIASNSAGQSAWSPAAYLRAS
jgi:hypothetical protein